MMNFLQTFSAPNDWVAANELLSAIRENTTFNLWTEGWCLFGAVSLVVSGLTLLTIGREFRKDRIDSECQRKLLLDIIRHLYRNKICTLAMQAKVRSCAQNGTFCYPSEEHYLKMRLLSTDIHLEQYYKDPDKFRKLHEIELLLRNYNTEIEVACQHAMNRSIRRPEKGRSVQDRDFATLDFKPGYITNQIVGLMQSLWPKKGDARSIAVELLREEHRNNKKRNSDRTLWGVAYAEELDRMRDGESERDWYFSKIFQTGSEQAELREMLRVDTLIECGLNSKREEKIGIVEIEG